MPSDPVEAGGGQGARAPGQHGLAAALAVPPDPSSPAQPRPGKLFLTRPRRVRNARARTQARALLADLVRRGLVEGKQLEECQAALASHPAEAQEPSPAPEGPAGPARPPPSPEWIAEARAVAAQRRKDWKVEKSRRWRAAALPTRPPKAERPRCGARTRAGGSCKAPAVWFPGAPCPRNGRCRMHGGLSTGPKTAEGRARCLAAVRRGPRGHFLAHAPAKE